MAEGGAHSLALAVVGGLACGGLALAGVNRAWAAVDIVAPGMPRAVVETTGSSVVPAVGALALVVVTGSLALLPTGGRMRQAIAVVVTLAAAGVAGGCALAGDALDLAVLADVSASAAAGGTDPQALAAGAEHPRWREVTLVAGIAAAALGAWACWRSADWPVMGRRYEAPAAAPAAPPAEPEESLETDLWRAMDRGHDPT